MSVAIERRREQDRLRQQRHRDRRRLLNAPQDAQQHAHTGDSSPINPHPESVVQAKTYLLNDAPAQATRDDRGNWLPKTGRTIITNIPPGRPAHEVPAGSDDWAYSGGSVTFENGRYVTSDPVEQFYLDQRNNWCSEAEWAQAWLSPAELEQKRLEQQERELREGEQELRRLAVEVRKLKLKNASYGLS